MRTCASILSYLLMYHAETKIAEFANNVEVGEVVHNGPSHLDLHCLPYSHDIACT